MQIERNGQVFQAKAFLVELEDGSLVYGESSGQPQAVAAPAKEEKPKRRGGGRRKAKATVETTAPAPAPTPAPKAEAPKRRGGGKPKGKNDKNVCVPLSECLGVGVYSGKKGDFPVAIWKRYGHTYLLLFISKDEQWAYGFNGAFRPAKDKLSEIVWFS